MSRTYYKLIIFFLCGMSGFGISEIHHLLNRPHFEYKAHCPAIPFQSKNYINIANYNIRTSYNDKETANSWDKRKDYYIKTLQMEDEARQVMQYMQDEIYRSLVKHLPYDSKFAECEKQTECRTCTFSQKEPFPVYETEFFRIALKASQDPNGVLYGNFPYPYRLIIALKRHASSLYEEEWQELRKVLEVLQTKVCEDIQAEYTSYGVFQDHYYKQKNEKKSEENTPHFFMHFVFRFPQGAKIKNVHFHDPNPYDQFEFRHYNLVKEGMLKANSNFIYKRIPDIINFQEVTYEQANFLKEKLPNHCFIGYTAFDGLPLDQVKPDTWIGEILAIGYRPERFECLEHGVQWLSPTPTEPSIGYDASRQRIIIWGKFKDTFTGKVFYMFNTHYDHLGGKMEYVEAEAYTIQNIAKEELWFSFGERFYESFNGEKLYQHYLKSLGCHDVRDKSLLGHYGEAGSWGGFPNDPFAVTIKNGAFCCDTLDIGFTNCKNSQILFSYSLSGAFDASMQRLYQMDEPVQNDCHLASDHFMTGFYVMIE
ncbi:hypothetical protein [Parachlamydia acanthamoebae]|uniref:hypothetical protein n=1 Tax=Parachlamydia acanthamoebae TaxID=83552 RepID=UPI0007517579|nr:hypothetical protein [Parachlamydia acanthamoebae]